MLCFFSFYRLPTGLSLWPLFVSIQPPASAVVSPVTVFDLLASLLQGYLSLHWVHLNNPGSCSHLHYTITSVKSLLPCKVTHSQVPGFRAWISNVVQLLSHVQLCNPMNCNMPAFPVLHYLPEFAQTHVY